MPQPNRALSKAGLQVFIRSPRSGKEGFRGEGCPNYALLGRRGTEFAGVGCAHDNRFPVGIGRAWIDPASTKSIDGYGLYMEPR